MQVLKMGYDLALQDHLRKIEEAKASNDLFRWESVMYDYQKINQLADEINSCPACLTVVPGPTKYINELADSKYNAAAARYNSGLGYLRENNRQSAKRHTTNLRKHRIFSEIIKMPKPKWRMLIGQQ